MSTHIIDYRISPAAEARLEALVDDIEARPGEMVDPHRFEDEAIDKQRLVASLPAGLGEDDLVGILHLALLTECATESYAAAIGDRARRFNAGWLTRFNTNVWTPDELTHHMPYKQILMRLGFTEDELDRRIRETQDKEYVHFGGETPVHITVFGMVQEYLTDHWHGLIANLLREAAPRASEMAFRVKRRETLHTAWYRDMTALQIEAEPRYIAYVANELARFKMPGNSLVPELQGKANGWLNLMGTESDRIFRDLLRLLHQTMGNPKQTGELLLRLATENGIVLGPVSANQLRVAVGRLGGAGYGLVGEAALEMAGLGYVFKPLEAPKPGRLVTGVPERIRTLLRSWLVHQMATRVDLAAFGAGAQGLAQPTVA